MSSQKTELSLVAINLMNDGLNWHHFNRVNNLFLNNTINNNNEESIILTHASGHVLGFVALNSLSRQIE